MRVGSLSVCLCHSVSPANLLHFLLRLSGVRKTAGQGFEPAIQQPLWGSVQVQTSWQSLWQRANTCDRWESAHLSLSEPAAHTQRHLLTLRHTPTLTHLYTQNPQKHVHIYTNTPRCFHMYTVVVPPRHTQTHRNASTLAPTHDEEKRIHPLSNTSPHTQTYPPTQCTHMQKTTSPSILTQM